MIWDYCFQKYVLEYEHRIQEIIFIRDSGRQRITSS